MSIGEDRRVMQFDFHVSDFLRKLEAKGGPPLSTLSPAEARNVPLTIQWSVNITKLPFMTLPGTIIRGAIAGAAGTAAMDLALYARHRTGGGGGRFLAWEFGGPSDWKSVSAPAQVGRRLYEGLLHRPLADRWARLTNNLTHWGYGIGWGCTFGVVCGSLRRLRLAAGPTFGACVWASSYVTLPLMGFYKPIWKYSFTELAPDLAAHLVYGTITERTFSTLA